MERLVVRQVILMGWRGRRAERTLCAVAGLAESLQRARKGGGRGERPRGAIGTERGGGNGVGTPGHEQVRGMWEEAEDAERLQSANEHTCNRYTNLCRARMTAMIKRRAHEKSKERLHSRLLLSSENPVIHKAHQFQDKKRFPFESLKALRVSIDTQELTNGLNVIEPEEH